MEASHLGRRMKKAPNKEAAIKYLSNAAQILSHYEGSDAAEARELLLDLAGQLELGALLAKA